MKRTDVKSECPINFGVEAFGDPWSMIILRDMVGIGKRTFSEFLESGERISRSLLAERLNDLERKGIISKTPSEKDRRIMLYWLTEDGLSILPLLYEIGAWGSLMSPHPVASDGWFALLKLDRGVVLDAWRTAVIAGSSLENGPHSALKQLGLPCVDRPMVAPAGITMAQKK